MQRNIKNTFQMWNQQKFYKMIHKNSALYAVQQIYPKAKKIKKINKGYSHEIFEVETEEYPEKIIVKLANSKEDKFSLRKEKRIHEMLQEKGIPVPRVIFLDDSKEKVDFEFIVLSKAEGIDLEEIFHKFSRKQQEQIFEEIGEILGKIHSTKFESYGYLTPTEIYDEHNFTLKKVGKRLPINPSTLSIISSALFDLGYLFANENTNQDLLRDIFEYFIKNRNLSASYESPSLIHGDFEIRNIRVKKIKNQWRICSLLDFEYAASESREYDFIKLHRWGLFEKENLKESMLRGYSKYQSIPENLENKVKFMRITRDIAFAGVLFKSGNLELGNKILDYVKKEIKKN